MFRQTISLFLLGILISSCGPDLPDDIQAAMTEVPEVVDFNFHVRPILSDRCWACHGPDENSRKANLRLDTEAGAFAALTESQGHAFVKGNIAKSQAIQRIFLTDPLLMMPPPESKLTLNDREIATLVKWVQQGAKWKKHWAFIPPQIEEVPAISFEGKAAINPIDNFVQARLKKEGLSPNEPAKKERLLRRVSLDLRGLPPSIDEIDSFLADESEDAYEKVVNQMLASDAYAERMAMEWMDIARYADSHGMHADGWRMMWPWRDWVIQAFKENMPYNQFVTEQLAGDLIPEATPKQVLATAFNRNHPMTAEGGAIDEEFRLSYVFDRAETATTAFLGLTLNCARCHDHKFDPISQDEYYQMAAFFNNVQELGMTGDDGNYGPNMLILTEEQRAKYDQINQVINEKENNIRLTKNEISKTQSFINQLNSIYRLEKVTAHFPANKLLQTKKGFKLDGKANTFVAESVNLTTGKKGKALYLDNDYDDVYLNEIGLFEMTEPYSASLWFNLEPWKEDITQVLMGTAGEKNNFWRGWDFYIDTSHHLSVRLIHSLPHNYIQISSKEKIKAEEWYQVAFSYDGSGKADGLALYINGKKVDTVINYDRLYKNIHTVGPGAHKPINRPIMLGKSYRAFTGEKGIIKGKLDDIYIFNREISAPEVALIFNPDTKEFDQKDLVEHYLENDQKIINLKAKLQTLREERLKFIDPIPEVMVMEEMAEARPMHVLNRGQYDLPQHQVDMGTLSKVLDFPEGLPKNRLGFSKWLFLPDNPLTARVTVNRYWQLFFGKGLVKTPQDFGSQGALPSHPDLLDWLAVEFVNSGWDLKALHKQIVLSATYRQSSATSPEQEEKDPQNIFLGRGPSHRLPAEIIRDNALAASGLLVQKVGGESVRPYQPNGLWIEKGNFSHVLLRYKESQGDSLYRRSLYTFVKRTSPHPAMTAFDAPNRDVCTVQRENTTTPLQALVLLNDPQFVEAAKVLAERIQKEGGETLEEQINFAFRLSTGRKAQSKEIAILKDLYEDKLNRFQTHPEEASALLEVGEYQLDEKLDRSHTAALALLSSTILNHDEAYTKR